MSQVSKLSQEQCLSTYFVRTLKTIENHRIGQSTFENSRKLLGRNLVVTPCTPELCKALLFYHIVDIDTLAFEK